MSSNKQRPALARRRFLPIVGAALLSGYLVLVTPGGAGAITFSVNSTVDAVDANPGDGACATGAGECTLRGAIQESNALPGADSVSLPAGTYVLGLQGAGEEAAATGDLDVSDSLEIDGAGSAIAIIDGGRFMGGLQLGESPFDVHPSTTVLMSDLTIQNAGYALSAGGGIFNRGDLTLNRSILRGNVADSGAGVYNLGGALTVNSSSFIGNSGGTGLSAGAGILSEGGGSMTLDDIEFINNSVGLFGGAIANASTANLNNVTLDNNMASTGPGGAIYNVDIMTLTNSALIGNTGSPGGGIFNGTNGAVVASNSTISGNHFGGVVNEGNATLVNLTIGSNDELAGIHNETPMDVPGSLIITNTIVANNSAGDCGGSAASAMVSTGHNLSSDGTCPFSGSGDLMNTDPLLGPLAGNGGPTQTHALLAGSPAIDTGENASCPGTDQRGFLRPADGDGDGNAICDMGAFEAAAQAPTPTPTVAPTASPAATPTATPSPTPSPSPASLTPAPPALPRALPPTGGRAAR